MNKNINIIERCIVIEGKSFSYIKEKEALDSLYDKSFQTEYEFREKYGDLFVDFKTAVPKKIIEENTVKYYSNAILRFREKIN